MVLGRKYPVAYDGKKYYAKLFKYDWHTNECISRIYKRVLIFFVKLHEESCTYSTEIEDTDFQYFVKETIRRYLKLKEHEDANKKAFKEWDGVCH